MPLMYLYNFRSSSSKIATYNSPLCPLSNATSLIKIGFSKEELCQISHNDLIIDYFSRANLYNVPRVHVLIFGSKNIYIRNCSLSYFYTFLQNFNSMLREKVMMIFPKSPIWNVIQQSTKRPNSLAHISANVVQKDLKFRPKV